MKKIAIVTLAVALENEKGYSRFRFLANLLSDYYKVDLITSTFQHWEKRQRDRESLGRIRRKYGIKLAYEPGYKKNIDIRRIISHRIAVKNIIRILQADQYDLIYCIIPDNGMAAEVGKYAKDKGIKYMVDVEDLWPEAMEMVSPLPKGINSFLFSSFRRQAKKAYECAHAFVGTSDEYRDVPRTKYGIEGKPAITVYVGCDLEDFDGGVREYGSQIEKAEGEFWVTYAGNLGASYDISTLIRASQELYQACPNLRVKILGGGPLEDEFRKTAREKLCRVEFVGYVPYRKMASYLVKSDILVNSFVKKAPQSIVTKIGDYLAAGKPMINTLSSPEFRKKVKEDGFGINVEAENVSGLTEAIVMLQGENELRKQMGQNARKICQKEFDRKNSYNRIRRLMDQVIG